MEILTHFLLAERWHNGFLWRVQKLRFILLYWLPVLVWMSLIFTASGDRGSFQHSSHLIAPLVQWLFPHISAQALYTITFVARKGAHVTEYAVLAFLVWRAVRTLPGPTARPRPWFNVACTLVLVVLYAASDEFHQSFVPSREGCVRDVLIDASGALLAVLLLRGLQVWQNRRQTQPSGARQ